MKKFYTVNMAFLNAWGEKTDSTVMAKCPAKNVADKVLAMLERDAMYLEDLKENRVAFYID